MKFEAKKEHLEKAMAKIEAIVPGRDMQTLLSNVLLTIEDGAVNITASDMESTVRIQIPSENTEAGELIIRAKKLSEISKQINSEAIKFKAELNQDDNLATEVEGSSYVVDVSGVGNQAARFKLTGSDRSHFPNLTRIPNDKLSEVPSIVLSEMIQKTFFAISQEDNRYIYNGLCLHTEANKLTLIGTDGRRLAAVTRTLDTPLNFGNETSDIVVHAKAIHELQRIIDSDANVQIGVEQRDIFFQVGDAELSSRLLEGKFPDYKKVIPESTSIHIDLNRDELLSAFRQVRVMTEPPSFQIRLILDSGKMTLKADTPEVGSAEIELAVEYSGETLEIGFNSIYFSDILRSLSCEVVILEFTDASKPVLIKDKDDPDFISLIMPMKI